MMRHQKPGNRSMLPKPFRPIVEGVLALPRHPTGHIVADSAALTLYFYESGSIWIAGPFSPGLLSTPHDNPYRERTAKYHERHRRKDPH